MTVETFRNFQPKSPEKIFQLNNYQEKQKARDRFVKNLQET